MARVRTLVNTDGGTWPITALGFDTPIPATTGTLDIKDSFTDEGIGGLLQRGDLVLSATHALRVDLPAGGTVDLVDSAYFGMYSDYLMQHGLFSTSGGANKVPVLDGGGDLNLGSGKPKTSATSFSGTEVPNAAWVIDIAQGKAFQGNVVSARLMGTADTNPGAVGAGKAYVVGDATGTPWDGLAVARGDIIERNSADTGWTQLKAGAAGDRLILEALGGDFSGGTQYSIIELTGDPSADDPVLYDLVVAAIDGMFAAVSTGLYSNQFAIFDTVSKWSMHDWATSLVAGDGIDITTGTVSAVSDTTTGAAVAGASVTANGIGTKIDNVTIVKDGSEVLAVDKVPTKGQKKEYAYGRGSNVPNAAYLRSADGIFSNVSSYRMLRAGKVTGITAQLGTAGTTIDFEVHKNGVLMDASVDISLGAAAGAIETDVTGSFANNTFAAGDVLSVYALNVAGTPKDAVVIVEIELTS